MQLYVHKTIRLITRDGPGRHLYFHTAPELCSALPVMIYPLFVMIYLLRGLIIVRRLVNPACGVVSALLLLCSQII